ncbi:signal peptidase I [Bacillus suaedaesalsae]|uniref:Signal peptidase I n=1 Tax=Bacillus suaedaesalsae TaxID=2810349 RepID=A0ABS2DMC0_9BACI|nr:signal peptidase I [Bacillus suaedaesalsae]MBM6619645.1 signal peptidase I [Bacillus suaedaesalsae]
MSKFSLASFLVLLVIVTGCTNGISKTINDHNTTPEILNVHNITSDMLVIHPMYDAMDRGNHDFYNKDVVVDVKYYEKNEIERGDIIAYKENPNNEEDLIRVIGLPGEKVKIEQGQIFINGMKLDAFYGRAHRLGLNLEELKSMIEEGSYGNLQSKENVENNIKNFENTNEKEVEVAEGQVYVIGDDWLRTPIKGLLPTKTIVGKVLGYH